MKKMIAFILVLSVSLFAFSAVGEELELSSMSLDELVDLHEQLRAEITSRVSTDDQSIIGTGKYIVGTTIKPGTYEFTATECNIEKLDGEYRCDVTIYMLDSETEKYRPWQTEYVAVEEKITIALSDGMWFEIDGGAGTMREMNPTWAP